MDGISALRQLPASQKSIVVSMHDTPDARKEALKAGASAFFSKGVPLLDLAAAVRAVAQGAELIDAELDLTPFRAPTLDPGAAALTEREREILALLAKGVSSTEDLADRLFISQKTVKNHLASIFQKLSVADRTQAAIEAIRLGIARPK
jgi:two-component system response regulator DegU